MFESEIAPQCFPQGLRKTTAMFRQESQSVSKNMNFEPVEKERRKYSPNF